MRSLLKSVIFFQIFNETLSFLTTKPNSTHCCNNTLPGNFDCTTNDATQLIFWQLIKPNGIVVPIYKGSAIVNPNYYQIVGDGILNYTLKILVCTKDVEGDYTCTDNAGIGESATATLQVDDYTCKTIPLPSAYCIQQCVWYTASIIISSIAFAFVLLIIIFEIGYIICSRNKIDDDKSMDSKYLFYVPLFIILIFAAMLTIGSAINLSVVIKYNCGISLDIGILVINAFLLIVTLIAIIIFTKRNQLKIKLITDSGNKIRFKINEDELKKHTVSFKPPACQSITGHVKYDGKRIPITPFNVNVEPQVQSEQQTNNKASITQSNDYEELGSFNNTSKVNVNGPAVENQVQLGSFDNASMVKVYGPAVEHQVQLEKKTYFIVDCSKTTPNVTLKNEYLVILVFLACIIFAATIIWTIIHYNINTICNEWSWQIFLIAFFGSLIILLILLLVFYKIYNGCKKSKKKKVPTATLR